MTDRELLKFAAKAAALGRLVFSNGLDDDGYDNGELTYIWYRDATGKLIDWNPLTNDGDALRLAVKLKILIDPRSQLKSASATSSYSFHSAHSDDYAATRRAIVSAAAEIGKAMKGEPHADT
jgi:hypothetical protein